MEHKDIQLGRIAVKMGAVTLSQLKDAVMEVTNSPTLTLPEAIGRRIPGHKRDEFLGAIIPRAYSHPYVHHHRLLPEGGLPDSVKGLAAPEIAMGYTILPFAREGELVKVAVGAAGKNIVPGLADLVSKLLKPCEEPVKVEVHLALQGKLEEAVLHLYGDPGPFGPPPPPPPHSPPISSTAQASGPSQPLPPPHPSPGASPSAYVSDGGSLNDRGPASAPAPAPAPPLLPMPMQTPESAATTTTPIPPPEPPTTSTAGHLTSSPTGEEPAIMGRITDQPEGHFCRRYLLLNRIAVGGMAEVFRAKIAGPRGFTRFACVKKILPEYTQEKEFVDMFIDEARLASKLSHPNIAQVYEFAQEGGEYYLAMELVDGPNLATLIRTIRNRGAHLNPRSAAWIVAQLCEGLHYAHTRTDQEGHPINLVHRDVSPANVLLSSNGDVKLIDFGIAKAKDQLNTTKVGYVKGKPGYLAPEQATGEPLDHRADIYCAGIILYELLTGSRLFPGKLDITNVAKLHRFKINRHLNNNRLFRIPLPLRSALTKSLARDPENRYRTAGEMATRLFRYAYGSQTTSPREELAKHLYPQNTSGPQP